MKNLKENPERYERIINEVVVDAYDSEERVSGWFYYVADNCNYPFKAKCITERSISPLKKGEEVEVLGIGDYKDCEKEMFVLVQWESRKIAVPLMQLEPVDVDEETSNAVLDWHYWVQQGYEF